MIKGNIDDFVTRLMEDEDFQEQFQRDPKSTFKSFKLGHRVEKALLLIDLSLVLISMSTIWALLLADPTN